MISSSNYDALLDRNIDIIRCCKELASKYLKDDEAAYSTIQDLAKEYCQTNFEVEKAERALAKVRSHIESNNDKDADIDKLYNEYLNEDETEFVYTDSKIWSDVFSGQEIQEVKVKSKKLSDTAYEMVDDSLLCSNVFEPPVDPISKVIIREPYKNKFCGHIFEYENILNYIKEKKNKARCPYVGCTNINFRASDLRPDEKLKSQVTQYLESHQDDSDSSED